MAAEGRPILVVEDDPSLRETIAAALEINGYPVQQAENGAQALELVEQEAPSLVLLDMVMPVLDGREFAAQLRAGGFDTPILVMSASRDPERSAEEIGAEGAVAKPFGVQELLIKVEQLRVA